MRSWGDRLANKWNFSIPGLPESVQASGTTYALHQLQCPDTVNASMQFPQRYTAVYNGTMVSSLEDGGIVFRGSGGIMKLTRGGFWLYPEETEQRNNRDHDP